MFTYSHSKAITNVVQRITPYALPSSSVLRWLQKQDDDEDKS